MQNMYAGDASPSYLGPGQFGPMTKLQADFEAARQARRAAAIEAANSPMGQLMQMLFGAGKPEPKKKSLLDRIMELDRIGPK